MKATHISFPHLLRKFLPLFLVILVAVLFRFVWLDRIPGGVVHDELTYLLNSKAIALHWTDVTGVWNPLSVFIFHYPPGDVQAELPYFLFLPIVGLFPFSLFAAHATNAFLGVATVVVLYFLAKDFFGKETAFIAGIIAAANPWSVYINRTAYEVTPAVFFYIIGLYVLCKTKSWKIFWSFPLFLLGFYSYIGMKVIFPLVMLAGIIFVWKKNGKKFTKQYVLLFLLSVCITLGYLLLLKLQPGASRIGELFSFSDPKIIGTVDTLRKTSLTTPTNSIFDNKITICTIVLITKFFKTFSFDYLFVYGDSFFSLWHHGLFYYLDAVFLFIGTIATFVLSKRVFYFLLSLILIGTIPQLVHASDVNNFTPHIALIFPFMILFISAGIWAAIKKFHHTHFFGLGIGVIVVLYAILIGNFAHIYFFQSPIENGYFGFSDRIVARYAQIASQHTKVIIYAHQPVTFAERYLFYSNAGSVSPQQMKAVKARGDVTVGNVTISSCKSGDYVKMEETVVVDYICEQANPSHHLTVPQLIDGGEAYGIYNDNLCHVYPLQSFPSQLRIDDISLDLLTAPSFCSKFITSH